MKSITDNKIFWKTMKPLFSDKGCHKPKITLIDEGKITSEDQEVSNIFNKYFKNAITSLEIENEHKDNEVNLDVSTNFRIDEYKHHPSISSIKDKIGSASEFSFRAITLEEIDKELKNLNDKKASTSNSIPAKVLKKTSDICNKNLLYIWNHEIIKNKSFPSNLKLAEISPIFKKDDPT